MIFYPIKSKIYVYLFMKFINLSKKIFNNNNEDKL